MNKKVVKNSITDAVDEFLGNECDLSWLSVDTENNFNFSEDSPLEQHEMTIRIVTSRPL